MSRDRAFMIALANLAWASVEVVIECFQSLLDLMHRWHKLALELDVPTVVPPVQLAAARPIENAEQPSVAVPPVQVAATQFMRAAGVANPEMNPPRPVLSIGRIQRYYVVAVGRRPGIYLSWREAAEQVIGYGGNIHRAFTLLSEAKDFIRMNRL